MQATSYDVSVANFQEIILDGSKEKPIMVVFWSPKSQVCASLLPILDKLHHQFDQRFILARINCETEQQIVSHFGVQSVPSVFMFIDGQGVDGFAGDQTETFVKEFIEKHLPNEVDDLLQEGQTLFAQGQLDEAKAVILSASKLSPENNDIKLALAQVYLGLGDHESAKPLLDVIPVADQNMIYHSLVSQLQLAVQASQTPEIIALEAQLETATDKTLIEYQLAIQYCQANRNKEALALLYTVLSTDLGYDNGGAKKTMLDILETIDEPKLVSEYRRKLYSLLY